MMSQKGCELSTQELKQFDGTGPSGKLYVAVNGKIFDVTGKGSQFYGKGGPYELFAGRDASRSLATMTMTVSDTYDTLENLSQEQREKLAHWEKQFCEKYELVGYLTKEK